MEKTENFKENLGAIELAQPVLKSEQPGPEQPDHIIKQSTRILRPSEYAAFRSQLNPTYQVIADVWLNTGMRGEEFWSFVQNPRWYRASRRCIELPLGSIKKIRCLHKERTVCLTVAGCEAVETLIKLKLPRKIPRTNMRKAFILAASKSIGIEGITPKMFRKTLVSWLIKTMPEKAFEISASMGHDLNTMRGHYVGIAFERKDVEDMREFLKGWGDA
jgi:integrase